MNETRPHPQSPSRNSSRLVRIPSILGRVLLFHHFPFSPPAPGKLTRLFSGIVSIISWPVQSRLLCGPSWPPPPPPPPAPFEPLNAMIIWGLLPPRPLVPPLPYGEYCNCCCWWPPPIDSIGKILVPFDAAVVPVLKGGVGWLVG